MESPPCRAVLSTRQGISLVLLLDDRSAGVVLSGGLPLGNLPASLQGPDHLIFSPWIVERRGGRRMASEDSDDVRWSRTRPVFPADCPHRMDCHCSILIERV